MDSHRRSNRDNRRRKTRSPLFVQLLTGAVEAAAESVAIRYNPTGEPGDQEELSYRELDAASSKLARELIAREVGPGSVVAIAITRSAESVLSVWAIAKAGAAYVPIDPTYPRERIEHMVADSGAEFGLTLSRHRPVLGTAAYWIELDDPTVARRIDEREGHPVSYEDRVRPLHVEHPAYVLYTSGSTGKPKGVVVTHAGLGALVAHERDHYDVRPGSRVLHICSPNFDVSVLELLLAFGTGSTLVIAPPGVFGGFELADLIRRERVTHMLITPGALESVDPGGIDELRSVMVIGDRFGPELVRRWARPSGDSDAGAPRDFFNAYGPTEATIAATGTPALRAGEPITIGTAYPGVHVFVLDARLRPVPAGVAGELYLAGPALARGYLNRTALTASRFVACPFGGELGEPGSRMYRTGDLARRTDPGAPGRPVDVAHIPLEFLGRTDFQVKVRGFRVELGEIDAALTAHEDVDYAATLGKVLPSGVTALVSYVLPRPGAVLDTEKLVLFAGRALPAYMIPAAVVVLDHIPLNPVGKLDRAALPEPVFAAREFRAPGTAAERAVAEAFAAVLGRRTPAGADDDFLEVGADDDFFEVGADDDFFELGGNSLLAAQAAARIGTALAAKVPVQLLFEATTVAALADRVAAYAGTGGRPPLTAQPRPERIPLSYAQQRMWFLNRFDPESAVNNIPMAVRLTGTLDVAALEQAVADLIGRHEVLRTVYPELDGVGYQDIRPVDDPVVPRLERGRATEDELPDLVVAAAARGFDVTAAPPIRAILLDLGPDDAVLVCVVHHIAADGFSLAPLTRDLMTAYLSRSRGAEPDWEPPAVQYADYALWQRRTLGAEDDPTSTMANQLGYWRARLADLPPQPELPADRPRPAEASHRGDTLPFRVDAATHAGLRRLAGEHDATLFMVVHAALAVVLSRLSGTGDVVIGTPVAGRGDAALDDVVGMFVNTLVLRAEVDTARPFTELLREVRGGDIAAFGHADVPFERLVELLDPVRSPARHPLFQVMLAFQNTARAELELPGLAVRPIELPSTGQARFDLQLTLVEHPGSGLEGAIDFATDLFDPPTVRDFADRFVRVLAAVAADAGVPVGDLELLAPGEQELVLNAWNTAGAPVPELTLVDLVAARAQARPYSVAVRGTGELGTELDYGTLWARAEQAARALIELGAAPETVVAVAAGRTEELPVALLAVLMSGAAYLPLDTGYPAQRLRFLLADAAPVAVLTTGAERELLPPTDIPVVTLAELGTGAEPDEHVTQVYAPQRRLAAARRGELRPDNLAYIIYTSGSTGTPKGVRVTHRNVLELFANTQLIFDFDADDAWTLFHSFAFDFSVWELWCAFATGGTVVLVDQLTARSPEAFRALLVRERVTVLNQTPSAFRQLAEADRAAVAGGADPLALRYVVLGGEALDLRGLRAWYERYPRDAPWLVNMYGITETTVHVTFQVLDERLAAEAVGVIGRALPGVRAYVLDDRLHPAPVGVIGELHVSGGQLARGYAGQPGRTAARFVADPFGPPGARMYRSGDLGRWAGFGAGMALEYLGRADQQVQVRGFRIEPGEVEAALLGLDGVAEAAVLVRADEHSGERLVGYVVPGQVWDAFTGAGPDPGVLRAELAAVLPAHMVPDVITVLTALPLTRNGKLDRAALPSPEVIGAAQAQAPAGPIEQGVADVFAGLLGATEVGRDDDFFALGGNSLLATRAVARVNEALDAAVSVRDLFDAPTVAALAARVVASAAADGRAERPPLVPVRRPERVPLAPAQHRMWVLNRLDPESLVYNIPLAIRLTGELDAPALRTAVADVLDRHEPLRTRYPLGPDGEPYQEVRTVEETMPEGLPVRRAADPGRLVAELMGNPFDVAEHVPVRAVLVQTGPTEHLLVLVLHHICVDGASVAVLARDLVTAYAARAAGARPAFAPLAVRYADYAIRQREVVGSADDPGSLANRQLAYWKEQLAGLPAVLELPWDRPRPAIPTMRGLTARVVIPAEVHEALIRFTRGRNATVFMAVHAALAVLLARFADSNDLAIGTPYAGRGDRALDDLVGMFVNSLTLRTVLDPEESFTELLDRVRETDLTAFAHAEVPFEQVVEHAVAGHVGPHHPLFQVMLAFQNVEPPALELPGLRVSALDPGAVTAKFDLQVVVEPRPRVDGRAGELVALFTVAADVFDEVAAQSFARRFARVLAAVADDPEIAVGAIDLLDAAERERAHARTQLAAAPVAAATLPELMTAAVWSAPVGAAVRYPDPDGGAVELTYAELDERSNRVARALIARGVGPEDIVAVAMPRSPESVLAVWAIAKAGAAYLPIDPDHPAERVAHMIGDSGVLLGLTVAGVRDRLPGAAEWLLLDSENTAYAAYPAGAVEQTDRRRPLEPRHPAYVIYTSGSTGVPKGVVVTHAGFARLGAHQREKYGVTPDSRVLHFASPSFDASFLELLITLSGSATAVVVPPTVYGGADLAALLRRERVTHAVFTPTALAAMEPDGLDDLRVILTGGEVLKADLVRRWVLPIGGDRIREFYNAYGPTEATVATTVTEQLSGRLVPTVGTAIPGNGVYVLDRRLRPVPDRVVGELYLTGAQLARGYLARPGLTADRFVADPFAADGSRLYRTGDLVRWTRSGDLEFVGRTDTQVKIRGRRIELGEIDAVLASHADVDFVATLGIDRPGGGTILAAYVRPHPGRAPEPSELFALAERSLPGYMVPAAITLLDEVPLAPTGKLDRAALPAPVLRGAAYRAPATRLEALVARVFVELLGAERAGADDDFFALGGNSLSATRLAARLGARLDTTVQARLVFEAPTVAALAARLAEIQGSGARPALTPVPRPERLPLSPAQQRMWFLNQFDTTSPTDTIPVALRLTGAVDVAAVRAAVADVLARHEALRTVYPAVDGAAHQVVLPVAGVLPDLDPRPADPATLPAKLADFANVGIDVTERPPVRAALYELGPREYVFALVLHHIAADGASVAPLVRDLSTAYLARAEGREPALPPLPVQYADYTLWQRELLGAEDDPESMAATQLRYWQATLDGIPARLDLPADHPRPAVASGRGARHPFTIPAETYAAVEELARRNGASAFMVTHAAFAVLLARLTGTGDITVGTPVAGRGEAVLDDLVGMFVNTLVLRTRIDPAEPFTELLARVRETDLGAFANAELPFERLVEVLDPERSAAHHPLFTVALFFQNLDPVALELPGLSVAGLEVEGARARFDLQLTVTPPRGGAAAAEFAYATDLFEPETVAGFADRLLRLLDELVTRPSVPVGDAALLTAAEREAAVWSGPAFQVQAEELLDGYRRAARTLPAQVAVEYEGRILTYAEFDAAVNRLARLLIARGAGPETVVALSIRRSPELVIAIYAVLTAGAAYLPLDPEHPAERIGTVLDIAAPVCLLTTAADRVPAPAWLPVLELDSLDATGFAAEPLAAHERRAPLHPEHPAYVLFTSGSTGQPKGVAVPQRAIHQQISWMLARYPLEPGDRYLQKTATTFDVSLWGWLLPLRAGARLVLATPDGHRDPRYLLDTIAARGITVTDFVPSVLTALVAAAGRDSADLASLRELFVIGEALPPETVAAFAAATPARLHNLYGPTEAAVSITGWTARPGAPVAIGEPQGGSRVYLLDERLHPVPDGVVGELYLAGDQLARGYVGRPDRTAERFVADPFGPAGARMYRSGDLVRRTASGELEYRGRADFQVKFRGQRVELGEIEAALLAAPGVAQAVVVPVPVAEGEHLVGYLVPADGARLDRDALRGGLAARLPGYLVPTALVELEAMPLTSSGKLDRRALPAPEFTARAFTAPSGPVEELVAAAYAEVLARTGVGRDDDFFALGGNSLGAMRVAARIGAALERRVPVALVFELPVVSALAARLTGAPVEDAPALVAAARPAAVPLSPAQRRMWFLNQFDTAATAYNIPVAVRLRGALDTAALRAALGDLLARHETLRTRYPDSGTGPEQLILPPGGGIELGVEPVAAAEVTERVAELAATPFDVAAEVPVRVALLAVTDPEPGADEHVLVVVLHHIAADGWSIRPLTHDLVAAYRARAVGAAPEWAPLPVQYADYALWQRATVGDPDDPDSLGAAQLRYWRNALEGLPAESTLPGDRPRPAQPSLRGGSVAFTVDPAVHRALDELARSTGASLFMTVHTVLAVLLARLGGGDDIAVGTAVAGRGVAELDDVVGMFVNTLVLRSRIDPAEPFAELLARQRETDLAAFAHADVPFEEVVAALEPERALNRSPLFQVALAYQNLPATGFALPGLELTVLDPQLRVERFDLSVAIGAAGPERDAALIGSVGYALDRYAESTVRAFAGRFVRLLAAVAAAPRTPVGDLPLVTEAELGGSSRLGGRPAPDLLTLSELFTGAAAQAPATVAVRAGERAWSYDELQTRSARLARALIDSGIGPGDVVAIGMPRTPESVLAIWAVAQTGAAFVPVDPDYPPERVAYMVTDSGAVLGLTLAAVRDRLPADLPWLALDGRGSDSWINEFGSAPVADRDRLAPLSPADIAYVVYTSGSTGAPKGVAVNHLGLAGLVVAQRVALRAAGESRVLHVASPSFDASIFELLLAAGAAATLVIAPRSASSGDELAELLRTEAVSHAVLTPSVLATLDPAALPDLVSLLAAGEASPPELAARWAIALPDGGVREVHNGYGPTEATIMTNSARLQPGAPVTLGETVAGITEWVLDGRLHPVPTGAVGELHIAGAALAEGYRNRPGLTASRFVACPWLPGQRMYRTGDLVRRTAAGDLEFLGRNDLQVKIRGLRIEPGELEAVLTAHESVGFAVVQPRQLPGGAVGLVGYVLPADGREIGVEQLHAFVTHRLPAHLVPAALVVLDAIPLTPGGKLDRAALPAPVPSGGTARPPVDATQARLAEIFGRVLGLEHIGVDDSFFALGGDSISAIQVVGGARAAGLVITAREVFEQRTVAGLARIARTAAHQGTAPAELSGGGIGSLPLLPVLADFLDRGGIVDRFGQFMVLALPPGIDRGELVATLAAVVERHDALRARLRPAPGGWEFETRATGAAELVEAAVTRLDVPAAAGEVELNRFATVAADTALAELAPAAGRMFAGVWLHRPDDRDALVLAVHHYVIDGVSWRVLLPDLVTAWAQISAGIEVELPPVGTSLRRWAHGLAAAAPGRAGELPLWRSILATPDPLLGVRALDPRRDTHAGTGRFEVPVPGPIAAAVLTRLPALYHTGPDTALLTALAMAVRAWRSRRGVEAATTVVRLEGHGREEQVVPGADLARTVGWFTTVHPVALDLGAVALGPDYEGGAAAAEAVRAVKENLRAVPDRGIGFGMLRRLDPAGELAEPAHPGQISFNYLGRAGGIAGALTMDWLPTGEFGRIELDPAPELPASGVIEIDAVADDLDGIRLTATFRYVAGILDEADVRDLAEDWLAALESLAGHLDHPAAGGLTPSDVALVTVTQPELDGWRAAGDGLVDVLPVTPLQAGLLVHSAEPGPDYYVMQFALELPADVAMDRLYAAGLALLDRHAVLRTVFAHTADGTPVQLVYERVPLPWRHFEPVPDADLPALRAAERAEPMDPGVAPLLRMTVYRTESGRAHLTLTLHHLLLDGWSMPLLVRDLLVLYAGGPELPAPRPYRDYVQYLAERDREAATAAWAAALDGVEPTLLAPALAAFAGPVPAEQRDEVGTAVVEVDATRTAALGALATGTGVTLATVVQAAWALVLGGAVGSADVVFGAVVSGRSAELAGAEEMVGLFATTVPVRVHTGGPGTVRTLLTRLQSEQAALLDHHHLGLAEIQRAPAHRTGSADPLFDTLVAVESYPVDTEALRAAAEHATGIPGLGGTDSVTYTHYPITLLVDVGAQLGIRVLFRRDTVEDAVAAVLTQRLRVVLDRLSLGPDRRLAALDLLPGPERAVLDALNDGALAPPPGTDTLVSLFRDQVARTPDAPAVTFGDETLTYAEFGLRVAGYAGALTRLGAGPERLVAVALPRSLDLVTAIYAVLGTGAAYVPLDPDDPAERLDAVLAQVQPEFVLASSDFRTGAGTAVVDFAEVRPGIARAYINRPDTLASVVHTSGSTGRPKGVLMTHRQLVNQLRWAQAAHPHDSSDVVLHKTPVTFDIHAWELFWPLQTGARLVIAEPGAHRDPALLRAVIEREGVTTVHFVPSLLDAYLGLLAETPGEPAALPRRVFAAGEALSRTTVHRCTALLAGELHNWYGPAEATVVTAYRADTDGGTGPVPIGTPVAGTDIHVLDGLLRRVPIGAPGELYLAGVQLARGYAGEPGRTAERFVADPFRPGERLYRTGDIVRLGRRGLEYLGRNDFQVKLRGQRVEPGEVEAVLRAHPAVAAAAVTVADGRLVAYPVPVAGQVADPAELLAFARTRLPGYLVPAAVVPLAELPLTGTGKLDRRALPAPDFAPRAGREPSTATERLVAEAFAAALPGAVGVGADDDFFALGGTSLDAVRAVARLASETDVPVRVPWLFDGATVADLAARIDAVRGVPARGVPADSDVHAGASSEPVLPVAEGLSAEPGTHVHPGSEPGTQDGAAAELEPGADVAGEVPVESGADAAGGVPVESGADVAGGVPVESGADVAGGVPVELGAPAAADVAADPFAGASDGEHADHIPSDAGISGAPSTALGADDLPTTVYQPAPAGRHAAPADPALAIVLPLRTGDPGQPPLFCIHPMAGLAWCYQPLATRLTPGIPVYGIQSPVLSEPLTGPDAWDDPESLAELAERYVTEIRAIHPDGPYNLLGWSLGGILAHEVAVRLRAAKQQVTLLALLDADFAFDLATWRETTVRMLAEIGMHDVDPDRLAELSEEHLAALHRSIPAEMVEVDRTRLRAAYTTAVRSVLLLPRHRPGVFDGTVHYFRAAADDRRDHDVIASWRPHAARILDHEVPVRHEEMTDAAALATVLPLLDALLTADAPTEIRPLPAPRAPTPDTPAPATTVSSAEPAPATATAVGEPAQAATPMPATPAEESPTTPPDTSVPPSVESGWATPVDDTPGPDISVPPSVEPGWATPANGAPSTDATPAGPAVEYPRATPAGPAPEYPWATPANGIPTTPARSGEPATPPRLSTPPEPPRVPTESTPWATTPNGVPAPNSADESPVPTPSYTEDRAPRHRARPATLNPFGPALTDSEPPAEPRTRVPTISTSSLTTAVLPSRLPITTPTAAALGLAVHARAAALDVPAGTDPAAVRAAIDAVLERHPLLWSRWRQEPGAPGPVFELPPRTERADETFLHLPLSGELPPLDRLVAEVSAELDPTAGRNIRAVFAARPDGSATLLLVASALVVDDTTWRILADDIAATWSGSRHANPPGSDDGVTELLTALRRRLAGAERAELDWWRGTLAGRPAEPPIPAGGRRRISLTITADGTAAVAAAAAAHGAEVLDVLLAATALAVRTAADQAVTRAIGPVVRLQADGRTAGRTDGVAGAFDLSYPFPLPMADVDVAEALVGGPAAGTLLERVAAARAAVPSGGAGYSVLRHVTARRELAAAAQGRYALRYRDVRPARVLIEPPIPDLLLDLLIDVGPDGLLVRFDYVEAAFNQDEIRVFAEHWVRALGGLAEHGSHQQAAY